MIINMNGAKAPETPSPVLQEKTVTPETLPVVIGADEGYDGLSQVTVNPDPRLKAENIRSGKSIFGVTGAFVGEPQPTDELVVTALTGNGYAFHDTDPLICSGVPWNVSPDRLTELDTTTVDVVHNATGYMIGYDRGALLSKADNFTPVVRTSAYIPSPTVYHWYEESGSFEGETTFYLGYSATTAMGWVSEAGAPTHIKGSMYLRLGMAMNGYASGSPIPGLNQHLKMCTVHGSGIHEIEVDSPLTFEKPGPNATLSFKASIPEMEGSVLDYDYNAQAQVGICVIGVPHRMVIS